jgi:AraC-like DNA-binding protein
MNEQVDNSLAWLAPFRKRFKVSSSPALPAGEMQACEAGALQVMHVSGMAHRLRLEQPDDRPVWIVGILQRDGSAVLKQGTVSPVLLPDGLALLTSALPFEVEFTAELPAHQIWLVLPAEALHGICPGLALAEPGLVDCAGLHARLIKAIADLLQEKAETHLDTPRHNAGQHIANAVAHLLAAALAARQRPDEASRTSLAKFHLSRIKQFALANLNDSELTVRKVSEQLKISPSHIHRMFQDEHQTFGEWLWHQRLTACREALEISADSRMSISEIAFRHGFSNSSHFSRVFKARFGMSPTEARARKKSRSGF